MQVPTTVRWAGVLVAALMTVGCSGTQSTTENDTRASAGGSGSTELIVQDMWVKAADDGMSAAFGILRNDTTEDVQIAAVTSDASPIMELHETVEEGSGEMIMREKAGGFVIPAKSEFLLEPGANHLMLMDVEKPVRAGDKVRFSLTLGDGSTVEFGAPAKDFSGANERYVEDE